MPAALMIALQVMSALPSLIEGAENLFTKKGKRKTGAKKKKHVLTSVKNIVNASDLSKAERKEILTAASSVADAIVAVSKTVNTPAQ